MEHRTSLLCPVQLSIIIQALLFSRSGLSYAAASPSVICGENHYYNDRHEKCLEKCGNDTRCGLNQVCDGGQERCLDLCGENDTIPCNFTQYCDRDLRFCSEKCGIHPGCKPRQSCDRQHGNCLDLCGENDTFTCDVTQHCDRNLGICLDRCGPDNNFKCRQLEYCDGEREVCLDLCGTDDQVRCREDEYCDTLRKGLSECANICFEECHGTRDKPMYCNTTTSECAPCHHICDAYHIRHFPDCKIFCNDVYKAIVDKPNGSLTTDAVFLDITTLAIIGVEEHRSSNIAQIIGGIVGSLALVMLCVLAYLCFKKKSIIKGKSPPWVICGGRKGNTHESESIPSDPDGNRQDTTEHDGMNTNNQNEPLIGESSQLVMIHPNQDAGPEDTGLLQSHHGSSTSGPLNSVTPSDCLNPHTSCHASVNSHGRRNPSLSTAGPDAGRDGAVSCDNMPSTKHSHNSIVRNSDLELDRAHAKSPLKVEEQLTVPQQDTTPHDRDRRGIVPDYPGGDDTGFGDDDPWNLGEAAALQELPGNRDDLMRIPHQQADVDERAYLSRIISGFQFVVNYDFTHSTVTVFVRPSDITLGEAKRVLIEAGVPEEMLEVELFRRFCVDG